MCMTCAIYNPYQTNGDWLHEFDDSPARTINEATDAPGNASTNYSMDVGDSFNGSLSGTQDWDWVEVQLTAGETYTFTMTAGTLEDPYLHLMDSNGNTVATNDDINYPSDTNAAIGFTPTQSGTYYIAADSYFHQGGSISDTGTYTLTMESGSSPSTPPSSAGDPLDSIDGDYTAPSTINVYFVPGGVSFEDPYGPAQTTSSWTAYEQGQAMLAFEQYENIANVTFQVVTNPNDADFMMAQIDDAGSSTLGYWGVGNPTVTIDGTTYNGLSGHGVFNSADPSWTPAGLAQGGFAFITLIHEIGHGMGLMHPHDDGNGSAIMNGVDGPFGDYGDFDLNQGIYTTMTYNDGWQTGPHGMSTTNTYGYQGTPMALDIAVIQQTYGANMSYNTGNDTYVLPDINRSGTFYSSIWDAGGTDAIVHNGSTDAVIDLREATLTYSENGGGYVSYVTGIHGGFTIASGAVIENASGGSGDDRITGNGIGNRLEGNAGDDDISGRSGNDVLIGGAGNDTMNGGFGNDQIWAGAGDTGNDSIIGGNGNDIAGGGDGNDTMSGGDGRDTLFGGSGEDQINGGNSDDIIWAGTHDDVVDGDGGNNTLGGGEGNDTISADAGSDTIYGGVGNGADSVTSGGGNDVVFTGSGNDTINAGGGNDVVYNGSGSDNVNGGAGADTLWGGPGNDALTGGTGADEFSFATGNGNDTISDFEDGIDTIVFSGTGLDFGDLAIIDTAAGALVSYGSDSILLDGINSSALSAADFDFV